MEDRSLAKLKNMSVLSRLKTARKQAGLTQGQVAKLMGYESHVSVVNFEQGTHSLSVENLFLLCEIYGINVYWAMTGLNPNFDRRRWLDIVNRSNVIKEEGEQIIGLLESLRQSPESED